MNLSLSAFFRYMFHEKGTYENEDVINATIYRETLNEMHLAVVGGAIIQIVLFVMTLGANRDYGGLIDYYRALYVALFILMVISRLIIEYVKNDYENRSVLMNDLHKLSVSHIGTNEAIVSAGMAEYDPPRVRSMHEVFERADATMYDEKMLLKSLGAATRADETLADAEDIPGIRIRRHILIADDLEMNREILGDLLREDYDVLYAADGVEALDILRSRKDEIALVLLDLYMPRLTGQEVMTEMQVDEELRAIPVIVLTVDHAAELLCLRLGAMDFIPKPYPDAEIIRTRIANCIELSENRDLIRFTQRDNLTGLYNFDYFIRYVNRFDQQYRGTATDAIVCDVNRFYSVNEEYGRQFGDLVLRSIGISFKKLARKVNGIAGRKSADTFLLYCPHREDYDQLLQKLLSDIFIKEETAQKVSLRFGVFSDAGRETDVEKRFAFAKLAADRTRNDPHSPVGFYTL